MNNNLDVLHTSPWMYSVIERIKEKQTEIHHWLESYEFDLLSPLYSSVDIRDAGFKIAVVDTNIFPAGFNNLCEHGLEDSVEYIRNAILKRVPKCQNIIIVAEEHTRNTWYLENVRILQEIIQKAGFNVKIATFLMVQPAFCEGASYVELETATKHPVRIFCFKRILSEFEAGRQDFDLIILNNDLTSGIPEVLKNSKIPIYPSTHAGWHSRHKSQHFAFTERLMGEFSKIMDMDSWFFSATYDVVDGVNINIEQDRQKLMDVTSSLFKKIHAKYLEHKIKEKPFVMIKSDSGTYGMGVIPVEDPKDILELNRRNRNDLNKGKGSQIINRFLLQEGVPTIYNIDHEVSEACIYQIENNMVGGFYRVNSSKTNRENLSSPGMTFKKMCPHLTKYGQCGIHEDLTIFDVYRVLARVAAVAARQEIMQLEAQQK